MTAGRAVARRWGTHWRQSGAAVVEFAFVFPILFLLVYGVIVYAYIYVLKQSIVYAAQEAAEAAVAVDPAIDDAFTRQQAVVRATAVSALSWLPVSQRARVVGTAGERVEVSLCPAGTPDCPVDGDALRVTLRFDLANPSSLFPVLNLYIVGTVPPLPDTLTATAVVRI
ncbi:TadE/TadG family type IV pilus assembly protein [Sinimarinibacterium thermocellulolyticum]|uniref:TadE/TadG family type IV pilus assembly protein n=1 Tax=Sinimarinibacterium thermocellulolyticum TaxID=3170016 RepID=A0ABV2A632_9GAMM